MARKNGWRLVSKTLMPWMTYLDRLEREPTPATRAALDSVLAQAFTQTQINVHVISGRLRNSGYVTSDVHRRPRSVRYTGVISYGLGVPYSKYEMGERRRGVRPDWIVHPPHDPYDGLGLFHSEVDAVIAALGD